MIAQAMELARELLQAVRELTDELRRARELAGPPANTGGVGCKSAE